MTEYEAVIGIETHVQLNTNSKMFSVSSADYQSAEPNTIVDPVSLALPGTLPVVNRKAVESAIMIGLALNCSIAEVTKFDRKQYNYPDLLKGYQISQFDQPICFNGHLELPGDLRHTVRVNRVHMEEDVAKLVHVDGLNGKTGYALMDVNRAGVPLMEIVTEPDLRSAEDVVAYIESLQSIIRYIGVGTANMEEGSFRCDANISVRPKGTEALGTKVEVKNMNRVSAVARAVEHEIERQIRAIEAGERIVQETRGWNDGTGKTVVQRSKEEANDYRYFPEPDIPPIVVSREWVEEVRLMLPELPAQRKSRFMSEFGLSEYDARLIISTRSTADYFEAVIAVGPTNSPDERAAFAKEVVNWLNGEMARLMNAESVTDVAETRIQPQALAALIGKSVKREINSNTAKQVFEEMWRTGGDPERIIAERGLGMVSDTSSLEPAIDRAIAANRNAVDDYMSGKETAVRFLMGQVMKETKGQADPPMVLKMLGEKLESMKADPPES
ncbi:MAG: Asp-tRNA(Asn)/Glu-tRNA(Gln) amidotransferase subunit GatB [Chloroflexi bacterium]|nr:Asp-tRNA(Asn)/Glu-tRNA(Gln) amidotransferase subunit GatB [Chloroflexota bacterium]